MVCLGIATASARQSRYTNIVLTVKSKTRRKLNALNSCSTLLVRVRNSSRLHAFSCRKLISIFSRQPITYSTSFIRNVVTLTQRLPSSFIRTAQSLGEAHTGLCGMPRRSLHCHDLPDDVIPADSKTQKQGRDNETGSRSGIRVPSTSRTAAKNGVRNG